MHVPVIFKRIRDFLDFIFEFLLAACVFKSS